MITEYSTNEKLKRQLVKTQYKKHPKWKKRKIVRTIMYLVLVALPALAFMFVLKNYRSLSTNSYEKISEVDIIGEAAFVSIIAFILIGGIVLIYYKFLRRTCDDEVDFKERESLFLTDEGIKDSFHPKDSTHLSSAYCNEIKFSDITKIVLNKYHNRLAVYGRIKETYYYNLESNEVGYSEVYEAKDGRSRRYYLYYDNSEDFANQIVEKSNIPLTIIDEPEE